MSNGARFGSVRGRVTDADGRPIEGARIMIGSASAGHRDIAQVTGRDGEFLLSRLSPGMQEVTAFAEREGRLLSTAERMQVDEGQEARVDLVLGGESA